jgi:hypothetical protein
MNTSGPLDAQSLVRLHRTSDKHYSLRNALIGSTLAARRAGK